MWKYIRLYHNSPSQELKKPQSKFATKKLLFFPPSSILLNSTQTKLRANQQSLHLVNRGHTPPQRQGALQSQYGTNPALGIISKTLGWRNCTDAVIAVITKWPFSSTPAPRQDRTNPRRTNTALSGCLGTKAPDTGQRLPGEGCWQFQERCQTLSWSRTL